MTGMHILFWATAALIVYSLGFTLFNVPYLAMPVEMTESRTARISVMAYRSVFMMIGSLIGSSGAPYLLDKALGRDARGFGLLGLIHFEAMARGASD